MNKFFIIVMQTYMSKLKSKSFLISTAITALLIIGLTNMQTIFETFERNDEKLIAILDTSDSFYNQLETQFQGEEERIKLEKINADAASIEEEVLKGTYDGLLIIEVDETGLPVGMFKARSVSDHSTIYRMEQALQQVKVELATGQIGLTQEQIATLYAPVPFEVHPLEESAKSAEELNQARGIVYVLLFVMYFSVIMYSSMIATEVATEKTSRVMEILISSASPIKHMFGKILGIALLSVTQLLLWFVIGYFSLSRNLQGMTEGVFEYFGVGELAVSTFVYAIVFFLLGYFLFATLAAFLGSLVSRIEDIQQMIAPMTILIVGAFLIAMFGLNNPDNSFIQVTSFIPFFAPMIMFLRVGMLNVPFWEIGLSISILVGTIILLAMFGSKVYRGGVLMYGKSSSFKDIKKALQLTKKD